jgi:uncharacterized protein YjbI with pentapeptide repeats
MKQRPLLLTLLFLFVATGVPPAHSAERPGERQAAGLIASVQCQLAGATQIGSALAIGEKEGKIYFAIPNHLVRTDSEEATGIQIELQAAKGQPLAAELLPFEDKSLDLAIIRLSSPKTDLPISSIPFSRLGDPASLKKGDDLFHVGTLVTTGGVASAKADSFVRLDGSRIYFESDSVLPGWSGAGLFDQHWRLVGLILGIDNGGYSEALSIDALLQRLRETDLPVMFPLLPLPLAPALAPEVARLRLDGALKSADLADHRSVEALETLLFHGFHFNNSDLSALLLTKAHLEDSDFTSANFLGSDVSYSSFDNSTLDGAVLSFATLDYASLRRVSAQRAFFEFTKAHNAVFDGAKLAQSSFFMSSLQGTDFSGADLRGAALAYCDLRGADFSGANLEGTIFYSSILDGAKFDNAVVKNTDVGSAVADKVSFTDKQRRELRKSTPSESWIDIKVWGHLRESKDWDMDYPAINSYFMETFRSLRDHDQKSLAFRDHDSPQPVGALRYFVREGKNPVSAYYWFKEAFWKSGSNKSRVQSRVEPHAALLMSLLTSMRPVEGSRQQYSSWLQEIKERSAKFEPKNDRLILTDDAILVFVLARNVLQPTEIEDTEWSGLASVRCGRDAYVGPRALPDTWDILYPQGVVCSALPEEHADFYRKWTLGRVRILKAKTIEVIYPVQAYDLGRLQRENNSGDPTSQLRLLFANLHNTYEHLHASMRRQGPPKVMRSSVYASGHEALLRLPYDTSKYAVHIDLGTLPDMPEYLEMHATFEVRAISKDPEPLTFPEDIFIDVEPERAWLETEGQKIWEGTIQVLP